MVVTIAIIGLSGWVLFQSSTPVWPKVLLLGDVAVVLLGPWLLLPYWTRRNHKGTSGAMSARPEPTPLFSRRRLTWASIVCALTLGAGLVLEVANPGDGLGNAAVLVTLFLGLMVVGGIASRPID
jgi:hypothetical protein